MEAIAQTRSGKVQGLERDGVLVFRGIPYATPPVGPLRWQPPRPEVPWDGIRDATEFSAGSAQGPFALDVIMGVEPPERSEDSLYLNVWTPACDDARRPVMVWIHGGAFMNGSANTPWYDGTWFARNGVVLVSINYRLAAFGFLHLADLFGTEFAGSGNLGLLDQIAALEWVRDSIDSFGGDPDNVTVFGESAGGASVGTLLGTPRARGLFHGAIAQSGAASWWASPEHATEVARRVTEAMGVRAGDVDALRSRTTDDIVAAIGSAGFLVDGDAGMRPARRGTGLPYQPVVDGVVLPRPPLESIAAGNAAGVRVMVGTNRHEITLFHLMDSSLANLDEDTLMTRIGHAFPGHAADVVDVYRSTRPGASARDLWTDLATDAVFRIPAVRLGEAQLDHGPVWMYLFTWETPLLDGALRSTHALEIPFVFHTVAKAKIFTGDGPDRHELEARMHGAWAAFASRGHPEVDGLPEWPRYDLARRPTMRFDAECEVLDDPFGPDRRVWSEWST
jgi:para-nitrobenzyl esterase